MGEKITILGSIKLKNISYEVELNKPTIAGMQRQIHIQSEDIRFEMDEKDFLRFAISVLVSEKNLRNLKGLK